MTYTVAVRALCEFTAKEGDLDLRFTPSPTAQEGMAGHAVVTARRAQTYQREVSLNGAFGALRVRGRADGYDPERQQVEEIKTYRGDLAAMPDNHRQLHWAQVKIYGHLLCQKLAVDNLRVALVYFNIDSEQETVLHQDFTASKLEQFFAQQCTLFLAWAEQEMAHRSARDVALTALSFPHPTFRPGQRALAEAMYKASNRACCLLAQAPTGIGKTIASLFPILKASAAHALDKIFFLTAKTAGHQLALDACAVMLSSAPDLALRVLELSAKTSACVHPDKACHGQSCPLAKGFYDRLPAARQTLRQHSIIDQPRLREIALEHQICPYYLSMEWARWSDLIVADYNYYFDLSAMLFNLTQVNNWRVSVLVDEAHNLLARARSMYSAQLEQSRLTALRAVAPGALKKVLEQLQRRWTALGKDQSAAYQVYPLIAEQFTDSLREASTAIGAYLLEHASTVHLTLQQFYFDTLLFLRLSTSFGAHSLFDITQTDAASTLLCIRNIVPAPFLKQRFTASHSSVLFSATLSPWHYYSDTLGMPENTAWIEVESPFDAVQLSVQVVRHISTRYQHRAASLAPISALIARQYAARPGNYLAFFSSFEYMEKVAQRLQEQHPTIPVWQQGRRMNDQERKHFLNRFSSTSAGIGFAVLGGAFGEAIDLPGTRLIGAFIATLGLPQFNPVNEQIKQRMDAMFGAGNDYTYLYPGIQKVVQAAGRVIRTVSDRGVVYLIDDRFARPEVQCLLPRWWNLEQIQNTAQDKEYGADA